jgi:transcriptional regulator with XRE-family HTH domain
MHYGKVIRLLRILKGLSQHQAAELLSISQQAYSKIEKKEWMSGEKIDKILNCLKISRKELEIAIRLTSTDK